MCWFLHQKQRRTLTFDRRPGIRLFLALLPDRSIWSDQCRTVPSGRILPGINPIKETAFPIGSIIICVVLLVLACLVIFGDRHLRNGTTVRW